MISRFSNIPVAPARIVDIDESNVENVDKKIPIPQNIGGSCA